MKEWAPDMTIQPHVEDPECVISWKHKEKGWYTLVIDEDGDVMINYCSFKEGDGYWTRFIHKETIDNCVRDRSQVPCTADSPPERPKEKR